MASRETRNNTAEDGVPNDADGVSDSTEMNQQDVLAIGEASGEQPCETLVEDENRKPPTPQSAEQRSPFYGGNTNNTFRENETCDCSRSRTAVARATDVKCPFCGKVIDTKREQRRGSSAVEAAATMSASETEPFGSALSETLVTGLVRVPQTPEPVLEDNQSSGDCSSQAIVQRTTDAVGQDGNKIPVCSRSESSVQIPCTPTLLTFYTLQQDHPATNEKWFSLFFIEASQMGRVSSWIRQMEEQRGIKLHLVSFGDEYSTQQYSQHFHTLCLEDSVTVEFQLLAQMHRKFRIRNAQEVCKVVPLHRIKSLCQNRIPGPTVQVLVESLCEPGEVCQHHLRLMLKYGQTIRRMLIPFWSSGQH